MLSLGFCKQQTVNIPHAANTKISSEKLPVCFLIADFNKAYYARYLGWQEEKLSALSNEALSSVYFHIEPDAINQSSVRFTKALCFARKFFTHRESGMGNSGWGSCVVLYSIVWIRWAFYISRDPAIAPNCSPKGSSWRNCHLRRVRRSLLIAEYISEAADSINFSKESYQFPPRVLRVHDEVCSFRNV